MEDNQPNFMKLLVGLSFVLVLYSSFAFSVFPLMESTNFILLQYAVSLGVGVCVVVAAWSAMGTGKYLGRTTIATVIGANMIIAFCSGYFWQYYNSGSTFILFGDTPIIASTLILLVAFGLSVAAQFPFLVMRNLFGWRLTVPRESEQPQTSIKDYLAIMFVFALAIAAMRFAVTFYTNESLKEIQVGGTFYIEDNSDPQGATNYYARTINDENMELARQQVLDDGNEYGMVLLMYSGMTTLVALFSIPIVWTVYRSKRWYKSLLLLIGIILAYVMLIGMFTVPFVGLNAFIYQQSKDIMLLIGSLCFAIWIPMVVLSGCGIMLKTKKSSSRTETASA